MSVHVTNGAGHFELRGAVMQDMLIGANGVIA